MSTQPNPRPRPRTTAEKAMGMTRAEADSLLHGMTKEVRFEWLPLEAMKVDPRAQRLLRRVWVKRHVSHFDANQIGVIVISRREDGSTWIIDGQHRVELLRAVGWGNQKAYCEIFDNIGLRQEAALFLKRNDKISVRTFDKFAVSITEGNAESCAIAKIVAKVGLKIAEGSAEGSLYAVTALGRIFAGGGMASEKEGAIALEKTLQTIEEAWGRQSTNFQGQVIEGIGMVHLRYGAKLDHGGLVAVLAKISGGAARLVTYAKQIRESYGGSPAWSVGAVLVQRYNRGRRSNKLEGWSS